MNSVGTFESGNNSVETIYIVWGIVLYTMFSHCMFCVNYHCFVSKSSSVLLLSHEAIIVH